MHLYNHRFLHYAQYIYCVALILFSITGCNDNTKVARPLKPLPFMLIDQSTEMLPRYRMNVTIILTGSQQDVTQQELAVSVMKAAIETYKRTGASIIAVNLVAQNTGYPAADVSLADCIYIPDGKGFNANATTPSDMTKQWVGVHATHRGFTEDELQYLHYWGALKDKYTVKGRLSLQAAKALDEEISQKMNIPSGTVHPFRNNLDYLTLPDNIDTILQTKPLTTPLNPESE